MFVLRFRGPVYKLINIVVFVAIVEYAYLFLHFY
ncbi:small membrane protein YkgR [Escherichia coli]|nr:small membrane protein YkgR [Escherichia coli]